MANSAIYLRHFKHNLLALSLEKRQKAGEQASRQPKNSFSSHTQMSTRRCFVALDLPDDIKDAVVQAQQGLRLQYPGLRYTSPKNLHLTLKFLGELNVEQCEQVIKRLQDCRCPALSIRLAGAGTFPPKIVWLAINGANEIQRQVDVALAKIIRRENRFMGHVTIARTKNMAEGFKKNVESLHVQQVYSKATAFSLQESHLTTLESRYQPIARFSFSAKVD